MTRTSLRTKLAAVAATGVMALGTGVLAASPAEAAVACPYEYFCAYPEPNFGGTPIMTWQCNDVRAMPWYGTGSWINNQTAGTRARFGMVGGGSLYTAGAYSQNPAVNWGPVASIDPC
ncbi:peptidase inhibitor family I36 protein [Streptomyces sp. TBY4]|uniref:peptidase inhibitor family I36 protein n=1 Tax=Streptomyces sp. TBY4 TaxID=2962030 RepID=UPI0020B8CC9F|nr:peptidase inhibitor family I36 protein [Streptomyces sp. TBY4]MCP3755236.1 peptidase inhibitor family I36 protein [Streptomyces sp. TBY4]